MRGQEHFEQLFFLKEIFNISAVFEAFFSFIMFRGRRKEAVMGLLNRIDNYYADKKNLLALNFKNTTKQMLEKLLIYRLHRHMLIYLNTHTNRSIMPCLIYRV